MTSVLSLTRLMMASSLTVLIPAAVEARSANKSASTPPPLAATNDIIGLPLKPVLPAEQRLCAMKTETGLGYTMLRAATGTMPTEADYVLVNYIGYLASTGEVFDQGMQAAFPVNRVIPGFSKGLQMLAKGSIGRFCIPAALGYGEQASGPIPANSDLVFQVELVDYKTPAEIENLRNQSGALTR